MGQSIQKDFQYGEFIGTAKPNETRVLRHPSVGDKPLPFIDEEGIDIIKENSMISTKYHGRTLLCGLHDLHMKKMMKQKQIFQYMDETSDELTALSIIHV